MVWLPIAVHREVAFPPHLTILDVTLAVVLIQMNICTILCTGFDMDFSDWTALK